MKNKYQTYYDANGNLPPAMYSELVELLEKLTDEFDDDHPAKIIIDSAKTDMERCDAVETKSILTTLNSITSVTVKYRYDRMKSLADKLKTKQARTEAMNKYGDLSQYDDFDLSPAQSIIAKIKKYNKEQQRTIKQIETLYFAISGEKL